MNPDGLSGGIITGIFEGDAMEPFLSIAELAQRFGTDASRITEAIYLQGIPVIDLYRYTGVEIVATVNEAEPKIAEHYLEGPALPEDDGLSVDEIGILGGRLRLEDLRQVLEDRGWLNNEALDIEIDLSSHEYSAPELLIALKAWKALYGSDGDERRKIKEKNRIAWLEKHYPGKDMGSRNKRIATVINPTQYKGGGAKPTE